MTLFFDARLAIATSLLAVFLIGLVADGGMPFVAVIGIGAVVAVLLTPSLRRRTHFYRILGVISGVHLALLAGMSLADAGQFGFFLRGRSPRWPIRCWRPPSCCSSCRSRNRSSIARPTCRCSSWRISIVPRSGV
ncbi:MAG: hypothetical protein R3E12_06240 [Candidatus Eisenbacteria bacterium]